MKTGSSPTSAQNPAHIITANATTTTAAASAITKVTNTLLFYIEEVNKLKAQRWAFSRAEIEKAWEIKYLIEAQGRLDEEIQKWEAAIHNLRSDKTQQAALKTNLT